MDDNEDVLASSKMLLQLLGHQVWGISKGAEAVDAVKDTNPDVVLVDIGLQDIDGIEVARRLAQLPQRQSMKVIAFSGYSERVAGSEQGLFDAHLLKGAGFDELKELLE